MNTEAKVLPQEIMMKIDEYIMGDKIGFESFNDLERLAKYGYYLALSQPSGEGPIKVTSSGYAYEDFEEGEMMIKDEIISRVSGREKGDGIEWGMVYQMMDEYNSLLTNKVSDDVNLDMLYALDEAPILSKYNKAEDFIEAYEQWRDNFKIPASKAATDKYKKQSLPSNQDSKQQ